MRTLAAVDQDFNLLTCVIRRLKNLEGFIIKGVFLLLSYAWFRWRLGRKTCKEDLFDHMKFWGLASPHQANQNLKFSCYFSWILPYYEAIVCSVQFSGPGRLNGRKMVIKNVCLCPCWNSLQSLERSTNTLLHTFLCVSNLR